MEWRSLPVLAVLTGTSSLAHADIGALHRAFQILLGTELVIPDVRFEHSFTADDDRLALSWPVVMRAKHIELGTSSGLVFTHMAEFQYEVTRTEFRGVLGERMSIHASDIRGGYMPFVEAGALLGSDGSGAVIGGGLAYGDGEFGVSIGVVARFVVTNEERRGDIALDLHFPFNVL